jgi:hypothetical protein
MELWRLEPGRRVRWLAFAVLGFVAFVAGCERDDPPAVDRNRPPETFITQGPDQSTDPRDPVNLFYRAHLFWRGEDADGRVVGFRLAVDDTADPSSWTYTTSTDSVFRFPVAEIGPLEHLFLVRAVDNLGKQDATPDTLRFESFTSSPPTVQLVDICADMPTLGLRCGMAIGDTAEVFSDFTWTWTGDDEDGEVVRWTSRFDSEPPVEHARGDTVRTIRGVGAGPHTLTVNSFDDAGAISRNPGRFKVFSNFDPKTTIDRSSVVATLERPWLGPDSTLVVTDIVDDPSGPPDTIPFNSQISMCWSSTDIDGPVCRYQYFFTSAVQGQVVPSDWPNMECMIAPDSCVSPTAPLSIGTSLGQPGSVFFVRGIDFYSNVEGHPDTLRLFVNFRGNVWWLDEGVQEAELGTVHYFEFDAYDKDWNPDELEFNWNIDSRPTELFWIPLTGTNRRVEYFFDADEVGVREIVIRTRDPVAELVSEPDTLLVNVIPAGRSAR